MHHRSIAWATFVGTFIVRVSRGRAIREFILGVLVARSLFGFLYAGALPLATVPSIVATRLIVTLFVTAADSATSVLGMLTSEGSLHPSNRIEPTWGLLQSAIAAVLLTAGGLEGLRTASIVAAAPFALIMLPVCASLFRTLQAEGRAMRTAESEGRRRIDAPPEREAAVTGVSVANGTNGTNSTGGVPDGDRSPPAPHGTPR